MSEVRELIHLGFQRYQPHPALKPWIECYWAMTDVTCPLSQEYLYPDGGSSLIFDFATRDHDTATFTAHQRPQTISVAGPLLGIRFRPTGARRILDLPMNELKGEFVPNAHLLIPGLQEVFERMGAAPAPSQIKMVDEWMLNRLQKLSCSEALGELLAARVTSQVDSITQLVSELGSSRRTAERLFKEQAGHTLGQLQAWSKVKTCSSALARVHSLAEIGLI